MKRVPILRLIVVLSFLFTGLVMPTVALANSSQTYTVLVGAEDVSHATSVMAYFPATLHIHVGDAVLWKQNTHEIHTVTFLPTEYGPTSIDHSSSHFFPTRVTNAQSPGCVPHPTIRQPF